MVLNNFAGGEALSLAATLFQGLFPTINVQNTQLRGCKVCGHGTPHPIGVMNSLCQDILAWRQALFTQFEDTLLQAKGLAFSEP